MYDFNGLAKGLMPAPVQYVGGGTAQGKVANRWNTPSDGPYPVFLLCQPMFVDNKIANNVWIKKLKGKDAQIDYDKFMGEWYNLYHLISSDAQIYLLPPRKGLQDQTYVNCMCHLPHRKDVVILSNFTAPGRAGEEDVAGDFLSKLGYKCYKSPYKFEGDAEMKHLRDDIYFGGYGVRTDPRTYQWIEKEFGGKIIYIENKDEYLYHLDCIMFVLNKDNVMVCTEVLDKKTLNEIAKVATIHPVTKADAMECVCNSIKVGDMILNSSDLEFMQKRDPEYKKEYHKNENLQKICEKLGLEITYTCMSEAGKSGAALSCFSGNLNKGI